MTKADTLYPNWKLKLIFAAVYLKERKSENEAQNKRRAELELDPEYRKKRSEAQNKYYHNSFKKDDVLMAKRREYANAYMKERWHSNPDFRAYSLKKNKEYTKLEKYKVKRRAYLKQRRESNPAIALMDSHRGRILDAIKERKRTKWGKSAELTGCTKDQFMTHIESMFEPGMSWSNHGYGDGKWHLDHIKPLASFSLDTLESQKEAFSYKNTRPLWHRDNIVKSSIYNGKRWYYRDHITA